MSNEFKLTEKVLLTVKKTIEENNLLEVGDKVLVGLSGGADSVCLLDILCKLKDEYKLKVSAAHLNHMIRGEEADRDEAFSSKLSIRLGVQFFAQKLDIPKLAEEKSVSEELAGREARYEFFNSIAKKQGYTKIATAHNRNDRAETVLMRIIRGTGLDGLSSIKYKRDNIIRPILDLDKETIIEYCKENDLMFCTDSTNFKNDYTRNKIRNELIPMLQESFNPKIIDTLCNLSDNSRTDAEFLNGYAERLYNRINTPPPKKKPIMLDIKTLNMISEGIQTRIIQIAAREVMGSEYNLEKVHFEIISSLLDKETGASAELPLGLLVNVKYGWLEFLKKDEIKEDKPFCYEIDFNASTDISLPNIRLEVVEGEVKPAKNQMLVDFDKLIDKEICIRNRKIGDKIVLYKDGKSKKLKDFFIDAKIPREKRSEIPLLCIEKEVVAVIGYRISENYKITGATRKVLVIKFDADC